MKRVWSKSFPFCVDYFLVAKCSVVVSLSWKILFWMRHSLRTLFRQWLLPFCDLSLSLSCFFFAISFLPIQLYCSSFTRRVHEPEEEKLHILRCIFNSQSTVCTSTPERKQTHVSPRVESSRANPHSHIYQISLCHFFILKCYQKVTYMSCYPLLSFNFCCFSWRQPLYVSLSNYCDCRSAFARSCYFVSSSFDRVPSSHDGSYSVASRRDEVCHVSQRKRKRG